MGRERGGETIVMWLFGRRGDFYKGKRRRDRLCMWSVQRREDR